MDEEIRVSSKEDLRELVNEYLDEYQGELFDGGSGGGTFDSVDFDVDLTFRVFDDEGDLKDEETVSV